MSDRELEEARREYREFVEHFSVIDASHETFAHPTNSSPKEAIQVERAQALERFLRENQSFTKFREQLSEMYADIPSFPFDEELWGKAE